jgi:hypothetical protein
MKGAWAADALAFLNPDGTLALSVLNPFTEEARSRSVIAGQRCVLCWKPRSVNSI